MGQAAELAKKSGRSVWKWQRLDDLLIVCASEGALIDADFDPCLELHRTEQVKRALTWALGSVTMTALQRKKASDAMGAHPAANITDSALSRGLITAFSWMGRPWRAFASTEIDAAIEHIGVPNGHTQTEVRDILFALKRAVESESG